jgi:hypothetical protein
MLCDGETSELTSVDSDSLFSMAALVRAVVAGVACVTMCGTSCWLDSLSSSAALRCVELPSFSLLLTVLETD